MSAKIHCPNPDCGASSSIVDLTGSEYGTRGTLAWLVQSCVGCVEKTHHPGRGEGRPSSRSPRWCVYAPNNVANYLAGGGSQKGRG
jgi:hypothetical protein